MQEHEHNELWERSLRGQLTPGEKAQLEAWLAVRPELRAEWEEEVALCQIVKRLPDVPVSSNFTALVMQAVEREQRVEVPAREAAGFFVWLRHHFAQVAASTAVVMLAGGLVLRQHQQAEQQVVTNQMKELAQVVPVPSVDVLKDYEAIRRLSQVSAEPDMELLLALQ
jgi:anti-sigma factor RsiW